MTVKEFNLMRHDMWEILMKNPEISEHVKRNGCAIVYDAYNFYNLCNFADHTLIVVDSPEQINANTLKKHGVNRYKAIIDRLFTVTSDHNILF